METPDMEDRSFKQGLEAGELKMETIITLGEAELDLRPMVGLIRTLVAQKALAAREENRFTKVFHQKQI